MPTTSYNRLESFLTAFKVKLATLGNVVDGNIRIDKTVSTSKEGVYYVSIETVDNDKAQTGKKTFYDLGSEVRLEIGYASECTNPENRNLLVAEGLMNLRDLIVTETNSDRFSGLCKDWKLLSGYQVVVNNKLAIGYTTMWVWFEAPTP